MNSIALSEERDEETCYGYCNEYQPHAVKRMFDYKNGMLYDMRWDEAGNLGQVSMGRPGEMFERGRFLFWTEDNRMHAAVDEKYFSYYVYDHSGERRLKLTGINKQQDVNADLMATYTVLNEPTLYPSAYMVLSNKGYTKHYYAGTERVAARLGGGGLNALQQVVAIDEDLQWRADKLFKQSLDQVNHRVLGENDLDCIMRNRFARDEFGKRIDGIPYQVQADVKVDNWQFKNMVYSMLDDRNHGHEKEVYFYHSDHLGSASWKKERFGKPFASERAEEARSGILHITTTYVQHLQYLPYGEPYINQRPFGYSERFTFTGKERDDETGYGYFGARYMDHELMTMWLSVDPMADKYPSISPYAYCAWNPVKLVDPDGREIWINIGDGKLKYTAGMSSEGLKGFAKKTVDALNNIYYKGSDEGVDLINTLCSSKNTFTIKEQEIGKVSEFIESNTMDAYARCNQTFIDHWQDFFKHGHKFGSGGDVMWNTEGYMIFTEKGMRNDPTYQLLHELCHAYDANFGMLDDRLFNGLEIKEWSACMKANCIGSYMGLPQQTIYGGSVDKTSGRYLPCSGTALFDAGGLINPFMDF